jgi:outer membrane protein OmpA-like peptidoglycan-associated protein
VNIDLDQKRAILTDNAIVLENIYFDLDKHIIKKESLLSLNKVVTVLNENPNLNIIINAYTDSRASDKYNIILSKKRANEVKKQLIINGISKNRLESEGFGETKPLSNCGAKCSEKEFALDRRVEFIIKK